MRTSRLVSPLLFTLVASLTACGSSDSGTETSEAGNSNMGGSDGSGGDATTSTTSDSSGGSGGSETTSTSSTTSTSTSTEENVAQFPVFGVSSPFATQNSTQYIGTFVPPAPVNSQNMSDYEWIKNYVQQVLDGEIAVVDALDPSRFFTFSTDATCFGPTVPYLHHPDGEDKAAIEGQPYPVLPHGDLGMWTETDPVTGEACAVAQLAARMYGVRNQVFMTMVSLASVVVVAKEYSSDMPEVGETIDMWPEMDALGILNVSFHTASIEHTAENEWNYNLWITYSHDGEESDIHVSMNHIGEDDTSYSGLMTYRIEGSMDDFHGNMCPEEDGNDKTRIGSLAYKKSGETSLKFQSRAVNMCGHSDAGFVTDESNPAYGQVDLTNSYPSINGWNDDAHLQVFAFDPTTLDGAYVYVWQPGTFDSNGRVFNIDLKGATYDGEAWYGYGKPIQQSDGDVSGFYCNWAGPGSENRTLRQYAQRQFVEVDPEYGLFVPAEGGSEIEYAPVDACSYDGTGDFVYDTNMDMDLSDETPHATDNGLADPVYNGEKYDTIQEVIEQGRTPPDTSEIGYWPDGSE